MYNKYWEIDAIDAINTRLIIFYICPVNMMFVECPMEHRASSTLQICILKQESQYFKCAIGLHACLLVQWHPFLRIWVRKRRKGRCN